MENGGAEVELPKWKCHKVVRAAKITAITPFLEDDALERDLVLGDIRGKVTVKAEWLNKHNPQIGGYYVVYEGDGYASYSPAKAFEDGYTRHLIEGPIGRRTYSPEELHEVALNTRLPTDFYKNNAVHDLIMALERPDGWKPKDAPAPGVSLGDTQGAASSPE